MPAQSWKVKSPSASLVIFGLSVAYIGVCGLTSLWLNATSALLLCVLLLLLEVAVAAESFDLRHQSMPWLLLMWVVTIGMGASVGITNYHTNYAPYLAAKSGRFYNGVGPTAKAAVLMDAGVITFDKSMVLDDTLSVGLALAGGTYCAAPIMSLASGATPAAAAGTPPAASLTATDPAAAAGGEAPAAAAPAAAAAAPAATNEVQFWAIGLNCCGSRGGFFCDDAGEAGANSGLAWLDPSAAQEPSVTQDRYMQAIEAACALNDLQTVPRPLLLHWFENPKSVMLGLFTRALLVWIVSSIAYVALASTVCVLADYYFNTGVRGSIGEAGIGQRPEHYGQRPYDPQMMKGAAYGGGGPPFGQMPP